MKQDPPSSRPKIKSGRPSSSSLLSMLAEHGIHYSDDGQRYDQTVDSEPMPKPVLKTAKRLKKLSRQNRGTTQRQYPWNKMEHGDSFLVGDAASRRAARTSLSAYLKSTKCHLDGEYFMVSEKTPEGYRCWLIAAHELPAVSFDDPKPLVVEKNHPIPRTDP